VTASPYFRLPNSFASDAIAGCTSVEGLWEIGVSGQSAVWRQPGQVDRHRRFTTQMNKNAADSIAKVVKRKAAQGKIGKCKNVAKVIAPAQFGSPVASMRQPVTEPKYGAQFAND
jgi:hypothetical protein